MHSNREIFAGLLAPFGENEVKMRSAAGGRQISYITARNVMNRLDDVVGPENWWDRYVPGEKSVQCELTIRLPDGSTLTKSDAGGYAGMADLGDDDKSGYSDAFKRAAVKFGIGRHLYGDGLPRFMSKAPAEARAVSADPGPPPPQRSAPDPRLSPRQEYKPESSRSNSNKSGASNSPPKTGKAFFSWVKDQEQRHSVALFKYISNWAKLQEFPGRIVEWNAEQVALALEESNRKLSSLTPLEEALAN